MNSVNQPTPDPSQEGSCALALSRRQFFRTGAAALAAAALPGRLQAGYTKLKIGAPDWNLKLEARPASVELAKSVGFDGVQISLGHSSDPKNPPAHLPVSAPELFDQYQSKAVLVYYDVGNSFNNGFDIYKEIGWLGKDRICEFHLKDNPHLLGEGKINFPKVIAAIVETGFSGWAQLETSAPSGDVKKDMKTNLDYIRGLLART